MTPEAWDNCTDPGEMLNALGRGAPGRKLRLFVVACCLGSWSELYEERCRKLVELADRYADGRAGKAELAEARRIAYPEGMTLIIAPDALRAATQVVTPGRADQAQARKAAWLREVFGNPFRPARFPGPPATRPDTVTRLAWGIYQERRFHDLPILADALEEAGWCDAELLGHLRGPGPHALGCWALDLVLRKG